MHIGSIEKLQLTTTGSPLLIRCKTFLFVTFVIPREKECHDIYMTLQKLYQPGEIMNIRRRKTDSQTFFYFNKIFILFQFILQICIAFNIHQAMKNCPKLPDGITFRWRVNSSVNMYRMIVGHCAI